MNITIIVEGATEKAFKEKLHEFLRLRLEKMPRLRYLVCDGRIPTGEKLKRRVENLLADGDHLVIALTDVYTGTRVFNDAADAKARMREWVGPEERFVPHAAQHDFEAWLLPYWPTILKLAGHNKSAPPGMPESVNHKNPPADRIAEVFRLGKRRAYSKPREAARILRDNDLLTAVRKCPELRSLVNTILTRCGGQEV